MGYLELTEDFFTIRDREEQLHQLIAALSRLIEHLQRETNLAVSAAPYEAGRKDARSLLSMGFTPQELWALSRGGARSVRAIQIQRVGFSRGMGWMVRGGSRGASISVERGGGIAGYR
jgi:hypothetical protein